MSNEGTSESSIKFPLKPPGQAKVWNVVECVKKGRQGPPVKFSIQEIPEDRYEDVLDHMCKYFIAEEPICKFLSKFVQSIFSSPTASTIVNSNESCAFGANCS